MMASPERWRFIAVSGVFAVMDGMQATRCGCKGNGDVKEKPRIRGEILLDSVRLPLWSACSLPYGTGELHRDS